MTSSPQHWDFCSELDCGCDFYPGCHWGDLELDEICWVIWTVTGFLFEILIVVMEIDEQVMELGRQMWVYVTWSLTGRERVTWRPCRSVLEVGIQLETSD